MFSGPVVRVEDTAREMKTWREISFIFKGDKTWRVGEEISVCSCYTVITGTNLFHRCCRGNFDNIVGLVLL